MPDRQRCSDVGARDYPRILQPPVLNKEHCEIYYRQLASKRRGSPLWIPEPSKSLPIQYQRKGVCIGDVGIITAYGGFDFLFNICLPHDHPFNPEQLPDGFAPLILKASDIHQYCEFKADSYFASTSILKFQRDGDLSGLTFESSASEGAILTMPVGSNSQDLGNMAKFRLYIKANAERWYKYVNDPEVCGREARNGDVRLVIGHDKTASWGMAAFANVTAQGSQLKFRPMRETSAGRTYGWEYSGIDAEARAGPDPDEVEALRMGDPSQETSSYENQCLFVRTLNVTLAGKMWEELGFEVDSGGLSIQDNPGTATHPPHASLMGSTTPGSSPQSNGSSSMSASNKRGGAGESPMSAHSVYVSQFIPTLTVHPSNEINKMVLDLALHKHHDAKMVITDDRDWISVLSKDDVALPSAKEIFSRIMKTHLITFEDDVISLVSNCQGSQHPDSQVSMSSLPPDDQIIFPDISPRLEGSGSARISRPVSWAESFESTHSDVTDGNRGMASRPLRALIPEANFGALREEGADARDNPRVKLESVLQQQKGGLLERMKERKERHLDNQELTPSTPRTSSAVETKINVQPSDSMWEGWTPEVAAANASNNNLNVPNDRVQLEAYTRNPNISPPTSHHLPKRQWHSSVLPPAPGESLSDQPLSWGLTPTPTPADRRSVGASNIAAGLAKRAMEKMSTRKWMGMRLTHDEAKSVSSSNWGYSSSSNSSSVYSSSLTSSSVYSSSFASGSDSDPFSHNQKDIFLGQKLRDPITGGRPAATSSAGDGELVFKKSLDACVRDTGVRVGNGLEGWRAHFTSIRDSKGDWEEERAMEELRLAIRNVEERSLPALVVRCTQHLLVWGVQEEALFRVSGRPSHVSKLRAEFDSGADYDMLECSPGNLDPHAVASVLKAFLRELPEPILTRKLQPYFDAAVNKETSLNNTNVSSPVLPPSSPTGMTMSTAARQSGRGGVPNTSLTLPMALRKPPSLSTLAMPTSTGFSPPSSAFIQAIQALVCQLPQENRDLVHTVVQLIKATAKEVKTTKMPLSNLLLVLCPNLGMTPLLLKAMCEVDEIWVDEVGVRVENSVPALAGDQEFSKDGGAVDQSNSK